MSDRTGYLCRVCGIRAVITKTELKTNKQVKGHQAGMRGRQCTGEWGKVQRPFPTCSVFKAMCMRTREREDQAQPSADVVCCSDCDDLQTTLPRAPARTCLDGALLRFTSRPLPSSLTHTHTHTFISQPSHFWVSSHSFCETIFPLRLRPGYSWWTSGAFVIAKQLNSPSLPPVTIRSLEERIKIALIKST